MVSKRGGLGKGLDSLVSSQQDSRRPVDVFFPTDISAPVPEANELPVKDIVPNPRQPRKVFNPEELAELVASIKEVGVLQPIVVRKADKGYELIMGERRLRACKELGLTSIPAVVRDTADKDMLREALFENIHRAQLNPIEEALAYAELLKEFSVSQEELGQKVGRSRPHITNTLRLLQLPAELQKLLIRGEISVGHARVLLAAKDPDLMVSLANKVVEGDLSVRQTEALLKSSPRRRNIVSGSIRKNLDEITQTLKTELGTKVKIGLGARKGTITIDFVTIEDLNRILAKISESAPKIGG